MIDRLIRAGAKSLLLIGNRFSEAVINFILANKKPETFRIVAVKTPGNTADEQSAHLRDMAVITSAIPLFKAAGDTLTSVLSPPQQADSGTKITYFGKAKQVWVERTMFGMISDRENDQGLTEHLADLLELLHHAADKDAEDFLRGRIGKILGGVAILRIGDAIPSRMDCRIAIAKDTAKSLRRAIRDGVVAGGGVSLMACRHALKEALDPKADSDARAAQRILLRALEEPIRTICRNAGFDSAKVAELEGKPRAFGIDVHSGALVDVMDAGIIDVASVVEAAIRGAVNSAALALTIDVLIHHEHPAETYTP